MSGLKVILICIWFTSYCSCDFSELVNITAIIDNSTKLPNFDDQVISGNGHFCIVFIVVLFLDILNLFKFKW